MNPSAGHPRPAPDAGSKPGPAPSPNHAMIRYVLDHHVELLALAAIVFVIQTGLVPFDFGRVTEEAGLFTTAVNDLTFPDIVSNIFLYVPFGVFIHWVIVKHADRRSRLSAVCLTVLLATLVSGAVEWLQAYSPSRVSSAIDLVSNLSGAAIGASLSWVMQILLPRLLAAAMIEMRARPHAAALKAYVLVLVIFAAIPFSFSFDVARLKQAAKGAVFVPFGLDADHQARMAAADAGDDRVAADYVTWHRLKRWSRWLAEAASFAVLAWLLHALLRGDYRFGRVTTNLLLFWIGGGVAVGLSIIQFVVVSRGCDVTDILFRSLGLWIGLAGRAAYVRDRNLLTPMLLQQRQRHLARTGCKLAALYILYTGLIPLSFDADGGGAHAVTSQGFLPFFSYFMARFDIMMDDVMEKFAAYAVFAALFMTGWTRIFQPAKKPRIVAVVAIGVLLQTVVELAQAYMPVRVTSLTDLILAATGCLIGALVQEQAVAFYWLARSDRAAAPGLHAANPQAADGLSPGDALIASLMDPHPDAPSESQRGAPRRTRRR